MSYSKTSSSILESVIANDKILVESCAENNSAKAIEWQSRTLR